MTILLSTSEPLRYTPEWRSDGESPPVFLLRAGTIIEREMFEAELAGECRAGQVRPWELNTVFSEGVNTLLADAPERDRILALVMAEPEELDQAERQLLAEVRAVIEQHWPEYRALKAQAERRGAMLPVIAFRRFCIGWENCLDRDGNPIAFRKAVDGQVAMDVMSLLAPIDMRLAGVEAYKLLYIGDQAGNSARPSKSDEGLPTSNSDAPSPAAGKSTAKSGRKTRA